MQHEWIGIGPELGHDERHALRNQPGHEGDVAGEAIELGNQHRTLRQASRGEGNCQLRSAVERIGSLAGLYLGELGYQGDALGFGEAGDCGSRRAGKLTLPCRRSRSSNIDFAREFHAAVTAAIGPQVRKDSGLPT